MRYFLLPSLVLMALMVVTLPNVATAVSPPHPQRPAADDGAMVRAAASKIEHGGFIVETRADTFASYNSDQLFTPASVWKIGTAATALSILGADFRFKTECYQDQGGALYIKGYGDPFLVSEEIDLLADELQGKLRRPVTALFIDQSGFEPLPDAQWRGESNNPYDAGNYALAVNFNTINIFVSATGQVSSAEPQTPTLPMMKRLAKDLPLGRHRINISQEKEDVDEYARELILAKIFPGDKKIKPQQSVRRGPPAGSECIHTHYSSKVLSEIVESMLLYSNNFIANQLFLSCGAAIYGFPANWQKARAVMDNFLQKEIGINDKEYNLTEGSGLARSNKITARAMLKIVRHFTPHANLLPTQNGSRVKSGTMTGVYSYAGYLGDPTRPRPFVIILNQEKNTRDALLRLLEGYSPVPPVQH